MDKKKLIGTIIGVAMFAALIAGATFAWLTFNVSVTNGTITPSSMNFSVNFTRGTDISDMPILSEGTVSTAKLLTVKAHKVSGSAPGNLTIYLNTSSTSNALITDEAINYAVCVGTCSSLSSAAATGTLSSTTKKALLTTPLTASATSYNIYFWLDGNVISNDHMGLSYSGYISAEATQTD